MPAWLPKDDTDPINPLPVRSGKSNIDRQDTVTIKIPVDSITADWLEWAAKTTGKPAGVFAADAVWRAVLELQREVAFRWWEKEHILPEE